MIVFLLNQEQLLCVSSLLFACVFDSSALCVCVCLQALAEQQKAQQLAQQQQTGAPGAQAAPGQAQTPAAGQAQAQVPQAATVAGAAAVPNAAVLVRKHPSNQYSSSEIQKQATLPSDLHIHTHVFQAGAIKNATVGTTIQAGTLTHTWFTLRSCWCSNS